MKSLTTYHASSPLTLLVEQDNPKSCLKLGADPARDQGPALFTSMLDAEIFRQHHARTCATGNHLRLCPLEEYDLLSLARSAGGPLYYHLAFGFVMTSAGQLLAVGNSDLDVVNFLGDFVIHPDIGASTLFQFPTYYFDEIATRAAELGIVDYFSAVQTTNNLTPDAMQNMAERALLTSPLVSKVPYWGMYMDGCWHSGLFSAESAPEYLN